jgi:hypothetical protein
MIGKSHLIAVPRKADVLARTLEGHGRFASYWNALYHSTRTYGPPLAGVS